MPAARSLRLLVALVVYLTTLGGCVSAPTGAIAPAAPDATPRAATPQPGAPSLTAAPAAAAQGERPASAATSRPASPAPRPDAAGACPTPEPTSAPAPVRPTPTAAGAPRAGAPTPAGLLETRARALSRFWSGPLSAPRVDRKEAKLMRLGDLPDRRGTTVVDDHPVWVVVGSGELYRVETPPCKPPGTAPGCAPQRVGGPHRWGVVVIDAVTQDLRGAWFSDDGAWPSYWDCLVDLDPLRP